jgi:hypothetical protein
MALIMPLYNVAKSALILANNEEYILPRNRADREAKLPCDDFLTIVVYDKQKTALVDETWSTLVDCLRLWSGHLDHPLGRFSY